MRGKKTDLETKAWSLKRNPFLVLVDEDIEETWSPTDWEKRAVRSGGGSESL